MGGTEVNETDSTFAIEATDLTKHFGDVVAVQDLDLAIEPGTVYGFLGPNGSGKTTTMRMLTTLTRPTSGEARIAGVPITDRNGVIEHVGYLPEEPPLFDELTAREYPRHVAALHDIPGDEADERIADYLNRFDLADAADRRISGYSTGMRKKTGLVGAILHEPSVLLLDEPTSGLDPRAARTVKDLIAELAAGETTIFLSTHILSVVEELADVVGVLHDGRLVAEGSPAALKQQAEEGTGDTLEDVFLAVTADHAEEYASADREGASVEAPSRGESASDGE
ncbi:ABC-type multidrug transport system, ATPase component [Halapricum desulfuricans]|uniref:ABC-type multidrug transport system, ATPase component n=1 Tax=Halapricum desulfuricans TaxID=2841257 RepID=A0A897NJ38_9EURY|nr:ABC transporter ATP-binding protein [Halapricum desulfuricans]QSG12331.1 ABC-type multidrug transport system, ATPase component [Halapricum desulfuricans]